MAFRSYFQQRLSTLKASSREIDRRNVARQAR